MALFVLAYLAGVLTIASPCIWPILPFALARADGPFRRTALPMLLGLALAFGAAASLAAIAGGWAVEASRYGRAGALLLMTLVGLSLLWPGLAARLTAPVVAAGSRLADWSGTRWPSGTPASLALGVATGLLWAPCAGPVLGLILTGAALGGPRIETSLLLLTYGLGAATSLAAGLLLGRRLLAAVGGWVRWGERLRPALGGAVLAAVATIWLGLDASLLTRWSAAGTIRIEQGLVDGLGSGRDLAGPGSPAQAAADPMEAGPFGALLGAGPWLNAQPLRAEDLRGKVVLVNFWTYSCINCLRVLPHVRTWAERYRHQGLVVVGVHTPEFAFEKDVGNVSRAAATLGVGYPVAIDNDFAVWRGFGNQAWPAIYIFGADGRLRHRVLGEGGYERSDEVLRQLLADAGAAPPAAAAGPVVGEGTQAAADARDLHSGETYVGYAQASNFASPGGIWEDAPNRYRPLAALPLDRWSLTGTWTVGREFATLDDPSGRIAYRFHARDLHLVLAPSAPGRPVRFRVRLDGAAPGADHGTDVDADGWGRVDSPRLYQLVRQAERVADRTFEIEFLDAGVRAYAFTFG
ncbi:redoxin domain-containing protein [Chelatococcus reniformis]|uniref:Cytochrome C biogenesis protein DipZ n=1 Tax=Chelatococcus reniformis TaxID=1494448 RepID=A0A916XI94_9HYPH|nr:redoxin domain-containing protein [Chelatococcus reniformis]GGC75418.1 cytochrome C biogenesis protein DipZ [Chelatococcus reniformis]